MGLETGNKIDDLNPAWPTGSDPKSEGDDHLRLIKTVIKTDVVPAEGGTFTGPINLQTAAGERIQITALNGNFRVSARDDGGGFINEMGTILRNPSEVPTSGHELLNKNGGDALYLRKTIDSVETIRGDVRVLRDASGTQYIEIDGGDAAATYVRFGGAKPHIWDKDSENTYQFRMLDNIVMQIGPQGPNAKDFSLTSPTDARLKSAAPNGSLTSLVEHLLDRIEALEAKARS